MSIRQHILISNVINVCCVIDVINCYKRIMDDEFMFVMVWCIQLFGHVSSWKELCDFFPDISHLFVNCR